MGRNRQSEVWFQMIKWFLNKLVYSEEELCKRRARDFSLNVWLHLHLLDTYSERDRLFWRVYYGGLWIRDLPFTYLCADLIAGRIDTRICQGGAAKDKTIQWIRANGLKHSWKCIPWFPTRIVCIKSAKPKNYSPASGFVCVTCAFPDFLVFFTSFILPLYSYAFTFLEERVRWALGELQWALGRSPTE